MSVVRALVVPRTHRVDGLDVFPLPRSLAIPLFVRTWTVGFDALVLQGRGLMKKKRTTERGRLGRNRA